MTPTAVLLEPGNWLSRNEGLDYDTSGVLFFRRIHLTADALKGHRQVSTLTAGVTQGPGLLQPLQHLSPAIWPSPTRQQQISSLLFTRFRQTVYMDAHESLIYSQNSTEALKPNIHPLPSLKSHLLFEPPLEKSGQLLGVGFLFMRALLGQGQARTTFK